MPAVQNRAVELAHVTEQSVWSVAALVLALTGPPTDPLHVAASEVMSALDLAVDPGSETGLAGQAAAPIHQVAALLSGRGGSWADQSDEALLSQGRASSQSAGLMATQGLPLLRGLGEAFATPGTQMLDVGTGVGALAVAFAEQFPALRVVGIDVLPRVLRLAQTTVAGSTVADRVVLREQSIADLEESETFSFAWVPAPFIPESVLRDGVDRVARALTPGGWLMIGHGKFHGDVLQDALMRFKTLAYGGTSLDDNQAQELLHRAGLTQVSTMPSPPGAPALTVGRSPHRPRN